MIILTVTLIERRYFTRERNKQHIHNLKLKRVIFILPHQGEIPENIYIAASSGVVLCCSKSHLEGRGRGALAWRSRHSCKTGHFHSTPKILLAVFYMQQLYANSSQVW